MKISFIIALAILSSVANTWHATPHAVTAQIALESLYSTPLRRRALQWAMNLLEPIKGFCNEGSYTFLESSTWLDRIKAKGFSKWDKQHFIDKPFSDSNDELSEEQSKFEEDDAIVFHIKKSFKNLSAKNELEFLSSLEEQQEQRDALLTLSNGKTEEDLSKIDSFMWRKAVELKRLIHYIGDLHQPLHASNRYKGKRDTKGDFGGNLFFIRHYHQFKYNNLHFIWDHVFNALGVDERMDRLTEGSYGTVVAYSLKIMQEYPRSILSSQLQENNTADSWAEESFKISRTVVYAGIEEHKAPTLSYINKGTKIVMQRLALAGYRIADVIWAAYINSNF